MFRFKNAAQSRKLVLAAGGAAAAAITLVIVNDDNDSSTTRLQQQEPNDSSSKDQTTRQLIRKYTCKPLPTRDYQLSRLQSTSAEHPLDVLVVGGGCTGSGTALDAATRGLSTALVERHDFGSETSSRSTKLIWAGGLFNNNSVVSLVLLVVSFTDSLSISLFVYRNSVYCHCHCCLIAVAQCDSSNRCRVGLLGRTENGTRGPSRTQNFGGKQSSSL